MRRQLKRKQDISLREALHTDKRGPEREIPMLFLFNKFE